MTRRDLFEREKLHRIIDYYGPTCIDVGAGDGSFAGLVRARGRSVDLLEVAHRPGVTAPVRLFDGCAIPAADKSYDTSICMFVLHHATDQPGLLRELGRVARRTVIIGEDVIETPIDRILGAMHLGTTPWGRSGDAFRSDAGWRQQFDDFGWTLRDVVPIPRYRHLGYPIARRVYVLQPN